MSSPTGNFFIGDKNCSKIVCLGMKYKYTVFKIKLFINAPDGDEKTVPNFLISV